MSLVTILKLNSDHPGNYQNLLTTWSLLTGETPDRTTLSISQNDNLLHYAHILYKVIVANKYIFNF